MNPKVTITLWKETHTCVSNLVYRQQLLIEQSAQNQSDFSINNARINSWPHQVTIYILPSRSSTTGQVEHQTRLKTPKHIFRYIWVHSKMLHDFQSSLDMPGQVKTYLKYF